MVVRFNLWLVILVLAGATRPACAVQNSAVFTNRHAASEVIPPTHSASSERSNRVAEAHAHYAAGVVHELAGEPDLALNEFLEAVRLDPADESLALEVADRLLERKQPEQALEILSRAATPAASGELYARIALIYSQLGKTDEAIHAARSAVQKSPRLFLNYKVLYRGYLQKKQTGEAFKVLKQAAGQEDVDAAFLINLGELLASFGQQVPKQRQEASTVALSLLNHAAQFPPTNSTLQLKLADGFNVLGDAATASKIYEQMLQQQGKNVLMRKNLRSRLIALYLRTGNRQRAMELLQMVVEDEPTNVLAYYQLGTVAAEEKQFERAAEQFRKVVLLRPDFEPAYYELAQVQINLNQPGEALSTLQLAREKFRESFVGEFLAAMACSRQKDYDGALVRLTTAEVIATADEPQRLNAEFYFQLGAMHERKGDYEQAEKCLQKSLKLSPNFAGAQNYLGYMWADRGVRLEQARQLIEKAVKAEPKNPAYIDSLGWVLFKLRRPREALAQIQKAITLSEKPDAELFNHLGDIWQALGELDKARDAWRRALAAEPNERIQKKLNSTADK